MRNLFVLVALFAGSGCWLASKDGVTFEEIMADPVETIVDAWEKQLDVAP